MAQPLKILLLVICLMGQAASQSIHIEELQEPLSPAERSYILNGLNWMAELYQTQGLSPRHDLRARLFSNYSDFSKFQNTHRNFNNSSRPSPTAYFSIKDDELVTWRTPALKSLFIHEGQHALLRSVFPRPPKWINEGLSECFEGFDFNKTEPRYLPQTSRLRKVRRYLSPNLGYQILSVLDMSEWEFNQTSTDRGLDSYTRSWALVFYIWSKTGPQGLGQLLRRLKQGENAQEILNQILVADLENDLLRFYTTLELSPSSTMTVKPTIASW